MARLPNPADAGINDVGFVSAVGSAVYFIIGTTPPFSKGDWFSFVSDGADPSFLTFTGEYQIASLVQVGATWNVYTTTIGTAAVIGT